MQTMIIAETMVLQLVAGPAPAGPPTEDNARSVLEFINAAGVIGYIIVGLSFIALALVVMHVLQIRKAALAPPRVIEDLEELLARRRVDAALAYCDDSGNSCFLCHVMHAGLARYRRSAFGSLELKGALEEAGQEQVGRLTRSTEGLASIAVIAPMLGLLGTVVGINRAFDTIARLEGFTRPDQLAADISLALITTILGLIVAIPAIAAATFFRNRIESVAAEVSLLVGDLAAHLEGEVEDETALTSNGYQPGSPSPAPRGPALAAAPPPPPPPGS